jgi:hypothetical protein
MKGASLFWPGQASNDVAGRDKARDASNIYGQGLQVSLRMSD